MTRFDLQVSRRALASALALTALLAIASCGKSMMQQGSGSSYLIVGLMQAASGPKSGVFSSSLSSDVVTNVPSGPTGVPTHFDDIGQVTLRMALKNPGSDVGPTDTNAITITGYHVDYVPNTVGAAVPASFDGALTGTVTASDTTLPFVLVHAQAKILLPLSGLANTSTSIMTVAHVTFYGHDQSGHAVTVTASISVVFADWADPTT